MKRKISKPIYYFTRFSTSLIARALFGRKFMRNELKGVKGPAVVLANHQAALDFANLYGASSHPMSFVVSSSFYNTLPISGLMSKVGVIPKQQFQTGPADMRAMKDVIDGGGILALYPAGLMCEDGLSTPIPSATYRFIQFLRADVYVARTYGSYFCTPKWASCARKGRTYLDVYKLATADELGQMSADEFRAMAEEALLFDAYRDQERLKIRYKGGNNIEGLENVLYMCPHCKAEFSMKVREKSFLYCAECGYEERSDEHGFLHKSCYVGEEIRYVSDFSRLIYSELKEKIMSGELTELSADTEFHMIDGKKHKFTRRGEGKITLTRGKFTLVGTIDGEEIGKDISTASFVSLPFKPGKYIEIQDGDDIYRCVLSDGRLAMKFINAVKIYYELSQRKA